MLSGRSSFIVPEQFRSTVASRPSTGRKRNNRPDDLGEGATQTDAAIRIHGMRSSACFWTMLSRRIFGGCFPWPQKFNFFMVLFGPSDCNVVRVLQETPFRSKSQARSRQHQPTNATSGDQQATETCATMQNGGEWPRFYQGGRKPRKVRGQLERREEQVLHSHTEKTPSLMVKYSEHGTRLRSRRRVTLRYRPEKIGTRKLQKSPCKYNRSWLMLTCHGFRLTSSIN